MKKLGYILLLVSCISSCRNEHQGSPEAATTYFLTELSNAEFENAASCATPTMQKQIAVMHTEWKMSNDAERKLMQQSLQTELKAVDCKEIDGIMICNICCNVKGDTARLELQQHDGNWFVHQ